eukprot:scaffold6685_cov202-Prasinococcus_capsulatus_cf.AAC.16
MPEHAHAGAHGPWRVAPRRRAAGAAAAAAEEPRQSGASADTPTATAGGRTTRGRRAKRG